MVTKGRGLQWELSPEPCKVGKCDAQLALVVLKAMGGGSSREQNLALFSLQAKWEIILYVIFFSYSCKFSSQHCMVFLLISFCSYLNICLK